MGHGLGLTPSHPVALSVAGPTSVVVVAWGVDLEG